jgi:hypothetical protein
MDGSNARLDGRTWPVENVDPGDCTHPSPAGRRAVAEMLMAFFKTDTTAAPWFVGAAGQTATATRAAGTPAVTATRGAERTPAATRQPQATPTRPRGTRTPSAPGAGPEARLISAWGFASRAVTDALNRCSGCRNHGARWFADSLVSGGFQFDGSRSALNLGTFPFLEGRPAWTLSVWMRPAFDERHSEWRTVFSQGRGLQLFYHGALQGWRVVMSTAEGTYRLDTPTGLAWTADTWHALAVTYDGREAALYWDGALGERQAATGLLASEGPTYLGQAVTGGQNFLGALDEVRVWEGALAADLVAAAYAAEAPAEGD